MIGFVVMRDAATQTLQGGLSVISVGHLALVEVGENNRSAEGGQGGGKGRGRGGPRANAAMTEKNTTQSEKWQKREEDWEQDWDWSQA